MRAVIGVLAGVLAALAGVPATAAGPDGAALDEAVRLGATATLAPLCGLRDEAWAFDLRRAAIHGSTGADRPDDDALRTAPGSVLAQGALGYAEAEALEDFAGRPPGATCDPLRDSAELQQADGIVQAFRALKGRYSPGS